MAVLRFVNSIQVSPVVRLNLNDQAVWAVSNETSFGMPEMRRSVTSSMLRDGEYVGATAYGNREISLVLELFSSTADAAAAQVQLLHRELDRPTNLLQYTPGGATNTVFFRTFRASPDSVRFDPSRKQVRVTILAEPFALGIREDLAAITVRNDPNLNNGLFADLTGIKGDVQVPLYIEYADGGGQPTRSGFAVGVRSGPSPYPNRFIQAESMQQSGSTSVVSDATFSGGSKSRCTFATAPAGEVRLTSNFPAPTVPAGAENWGVYRVFARVAQTVATDNITMTVGTSGAFNPTVKIKSQTEPQMVDLGVLDTTGGLSTFGGYAATEFRIEINQALMRFYASRVSGTGSLDVDYFAFLPADECFGSWEAFTSALNTTDLAVIDGPNDCTYSATTLTGATPGRQGSPAPLATTGRLPKVMPGNNRLVFVETSKSGPPPLPNQLTSSITMTVRYWPRYLLVRPVGS